MISRIAIGQPELTNDFLSEPAAAAKKNVGYMPGSWVTRRKSSGK
jgi:hypothetical protein